MKSLAVITELPVEVVDVAVEATCAFGEAATVNPTPVFFALFVAWLCSGSRRFGTCIAGFHSISKRGHSEVVWVRIRFLGTQLVPLFLSEI